MCREISLFGDVSIDFFCILCAKSPLYFTFSSLDLLHAPCHVTRELEVKNSYIFEIHDPCLLSHYATFIGLQRRRLYCACAVSSNA